MKETKVYVDELPKSCEKCPLGYFYDCQYCFLRPDLAEKHEWCEKDKHCPLIDIKTHDRELVKEVLKKVKKVAFSSKVMCDKEGLPCFGEMRQIYGVYDYELDQIQKEFEK